MKVIETNIPDVTRENLEEKKIELANMIVATFESILDETAKKESKEQQELSSIIDDNNEKISKLKNEVQVLLNSYEKEKKIKKVLEAISKLDYVKIEYNRSLKNEIVVFLKIMEKLSLDKISSYLKEISKISTKTVNS